MLEDQRFDRIKSGTLSLAASSVNPSYALAVGIGKFVTKMVAERRSKNQDHMIGVLYISLNRLEHYRHGERKRDNVPDLTNNMFVDYSIFGFDLLPRRLPLASGRIHPRPITVRHNA